MPRAQVDAQLLVRVQGNRTPFVSASELEHSEPRHPREAIFGRQWLSCYLQLHMRRNGKGADAYVARPRASSDRCSFMSELQLRDAGRKSSLPTLHIEH